MREIKFRAWTGRMFSFPFRLQGEINYPHIPMIDEDPIEFHQYTGLKDKNGKEIYEGDIIKIEETAFSTNESQKLLRGADIVQSVFVGKVEWDNEDASYNLNDKNGECIIGFPRHEQTYEVIGNIYETPELLK